MIQFKGLENAEKINKSIEGGFLSTQGEEGFTRVMDVIFFFKGEAPDEDKYLIDPPLLHDKTRFFRLPSNTKVFEYYDIEE